MEQLHLLRKPSRQHGGALATNKRRKRRVLSVRHPIHLVLRSDLAHGTRSLLRHRAVVNRVLQKFSRRFRIRIYELAVCGNHIHCLVKAQTRHELQNFFRVFPGQIAQEILREFPLSKSERRAVRGGTPGHTRHPKNQRTFWSLLLYSRLMSWGREYRAVKAYVLQNTNEALGLVPYKQRDRRALRKSEVFSSG